MSPTSCQTAPPRDAKCTGVVGSGQQHLASGAIKLRQFGAIHCDNHDGFMLIDPYRNGIVEAARDELNAEEVIQHGADRRVSRERGLTAPFFLLPDVRSGEGIDDAANHAVRANLRHGGGFRIDECKRAALGGSRRTAS
jgi:hypothetical protein